jgi:glycosyltransferase involved in cell wall biosynthesis
MRAMSTCRNTCVKSRYTRDSSVTIIIPARNEAPNLERLLPVLLNSRRLKQVVLVDDGSTDGTPIIAKRFADSYREKFTYVRLDSTPLGWAPKPYALYVGAQYAKGNILFFVDADTQIRSVDKVLSIVTSMSPNNILAFVPRFYCKSITCKASEAVMTALAYGFYGLHKVVDEKNRLAWFYGCCWAIHKHLYNKLGGHKAVKSSIVEDRAFAGHAKRNGVSILFIDARKLIYVKAYERIAEYAGLVARLAVEPFSRRGAIPKILFTLMAIAVIYMPIVNALLAMHLKGVSRLIAITPLIVQLAAYGYGALIEGYNPIYAIPALLAQLSVPMGLWRALRSQVYWKGRKVSG